GRRRGRRRGTFRPGAFEPRRRGPAPQAPQAAPRRRERSRVRGRRNRERACGWERAGARRRREGVVMRSMFILLSLAVFGVSISRAGSRSAATVAAAEEVPRPPAADAPAADLIVTNARVHTVDAARPE